jgi:hypothetical protein
MRRLTDFPADVDIENLEDRNGGWCVVWRRPGHPPRKMMTILALIEAQRAEDRGDRTLAEKLRKAVALARTKNDLDR